MVQSVFFSLNIHSEIKIILNLLLKSVAFRNSKIMYGYEIGKCYCSHQGEHFSSNLTEG